MGIDGFKLTESDMDAISKAVVMVMKEAEVMSARAVLTDCFFFKEAIVYQHPASPRKINVVLEMKDDIEMVKKVGG